MAHRALKHAARVKWGCAQLADQQRRTALLGVLHDSNLVGGVWAATQVQQSPPPAVCSRDAVADGVVWQRVAAIEQRIENSRAARRYCCGCRTYTEDGAPLA
jgi:hypothetical protein